jgi:hypothetical protein
MSKGKEISIGKMRRQLFLLGLVKIPMIGFVRPRLLTMNENDVEVKIKLRRRSKNHLKSMYFGALAVGADIAAGIQAFYFAEKMGKPVSLAFKGIKGEFHKRAETDIIFKSNQGALVKEAMERSVKNQDRQNQAIEVVAYDLNNEVVATFEMILSVRVKG